MSGAARKTPQARTDLLDAYVYIGRGSPQAAHRFRQAAESTIRLLAGKPGLGTRFDPEAQELADLRYFPIAKFKKYLIFYRPAPDGIEVIRVLHGARDIRSIFSTGMDADEGDAPEAPDTGG